MAVTSWPRWSASATILEPTLPVAPKWAIFMEVRIVLATCLLLLWGGLSQVGLNIDYNVHLGCNRVLIRGDIEVSSIEGRGGLPAGDGGALHARPKTQRFNLEHDFLRYAFHLEIAGHIVCILTSLLPCFALEGHHREFRRLKEPGAQIDVAHFDTSVDAGYLDDCFDGAVFKIVAIHDNRAFYFGKGPRHFGEEVPDVKADPSVYRIDVVSFNGGASRYNRTEPEQRENQ